MDMKRMSFSGSWYPAAAAECEDAIKGFLKERKGALTGRFTGGIVPHAGWYYSGSIACRVIASLGAADSDREKIDTILLFGAHMHPSSEPFLLRSGSLETPFGEIAVDQELAEKIASALPVRLLSTTAFPDENTFELQYPFIKYFYPDARIVVCGVPPTSLAADIGVTAVEKARELSRSIRIIGSTDMTHYGPDFGFVTAGTGDAAVEWVKDENDRAAVAALLDMDAGTIVSQGLENRNMCCSGAAAAAAAASKKNGAVKSIELDYATSFEKSRGASFVGYSGILYALS